MRPIGVYLVLCGYIVGLLVAPLRIWPWGWAWLLGGWLAGAIVPRLWRGSPRSIAWVCVGVAGFLAGIYLQVRQPLPVANDISHYIATMPQYTEVHVWGTLQERPQVTRAGKARFRLAADRLTWNDDRDGEQSQAVAGSVYTTMPLLQVTGLGNGDRAEITGRLYLPSKPTNPGQFDFQQFLAKQGIWAGLVGESVNWETVEDRSSWLETIRDRIVQAHVGGLGVPSGLLMSAMTMGRWSVDLPYELRDRFTELGLAHALAASGFHVGIVLNSVLKWVGGSPRFQFGAGSVTLVLYSALAGFQPSVCRAAFMGWSGILGKVLQRRVRSSGTLLAIATLLLLWNPLLIQNLGFQLSFLATFGLIVSTEPIARLFSFLPLWLAQSLSVPIAATLWTLPLQIYIFNVVSPIAIPVNLIVGELLGLITTVGFFSGVVAVVSPVAGSFLARGLAYPMQWMIAGLTWIHDHIGRVWFVRQIEVWQMVALYVVLFGLWLWRSSGVEEEPFDEADQFNPDDRSIPQRSARSLGLVGCAIAGAALSIAIIGLPGYLQQRDAVQVLVLDEASEPVVVVRDRQETVLIGNGVEPETTTFTLLPLFRSLGINAITTAIEPTPVEAGVDDPTWRAIADQVPITEWIDGATAVEPVVTDRDTIAVYPLSAGGNLVLRLGDRHWLVLRDESEAVVRALRAQLDALGIVPEVVCWSGAMIDDITRWDWPSVAAIAVDRLDSVMASTLAARGVAIWETRQGAVVVEDANKSRIRRAIGDRGSTEWGL
jgi:competence protein ComEC